MPALLIDVAVRAAVVLSAALLATLALRRAAAATRHLVWTLAVVSVLAMPVLVAAVPAWRVLPVAGRAEPVPSSSPRSRGDAEPSDHVSVRASASLRPHQREVGPPAANTALTIWAVVAFTLLARIGLGIAAVRRLARQARPADGRWRALLEQVRANTPSGRSIRLLVSRDIAMPMTWGGRVPLLLLPAEANAWSDDRATVVLLHELAHIERADWLTHAAARLMLALHWFNPFAWVALRAMTRERERACDDYVLAHGQPAAEYAQHLLDIARAALNGVPYGIAPAMARPSELEGRLLSILTPRRRHAGRAAALLATVAAIGATMAVAAAAPQAAKPEPAATARPARPAATPHTRGSILDDTEFQRERARSGAETRKSLIRALDDPGEDVREKSALGLGLLSSPDVVEPLIKALKDPSSQVREKAALGLAYRRDPRAVDALLEAAGDGDAQVREKAILALAFSGDDRAVEALADALDDPDSQVREKAALGLALRR